MATGREKFSRFKKLLNISAILFSVFPKFIRIFFWDISSRYSQTLFIAFRYILLKTFVKECGDNIRIGKNVNLLNTQGLVLGSNISIHDNCYIDAAGGIEIGDNVSIAHNSSLISSNHSWEDKSIPIKYNPLIPNKIIICEDVWIGCGCRILAGVTISSRSIIAAGAVVNKNMESNCIYGGVPAKLIKKI